MRDELQAILQDAVFARSPALSRLLTYLVEASGRGEGAGLKSYTVAVDGLGKSADYDPQVNTNARVLVARLRRALDAFYTSAGARRPKRLVIETGSYEVRLQDNPHFGAVPHAATPEPVEATEAALPARRRPWRKWAAALLAVAMLGGGLAAFQWWRGADDDAWENVRFPYVQVELEDDGSQAANGLREEIEQISLDEIRRFEIIRPAYQRTPAVNYDIRQRVENRGGGFVLNTEVVDLRINKIIYNGVLTFEDRQDFAQNGLHRIGEMYFALLGYRGVVVSQERKQVGLVDGAYGCWLRFSADVLADGGFGDPELTECADTWHSHSPDHPVATAIYAWTLVNDTFGDLSEQSRQAKLNKAIDLLERARTLYPDSRHVLLSLARAQAFKGDVPALREVSASLEAKGGYNLDIMSFVGTFLVLQNDMRGTELIDHAISHSVDPPARYFAGKFVAAMMKDDLDGARGALDHLQNQARTVVISQILKAAYEARLGHLDAARAAWELACEEKPVLRLYPGAFLTTLPLSPPVRDKLRQWLQPAVPGV